MSGADSKRRFESARKELQTLRDVLRWSVSQFSEHELTFGHGTDNAWDEALVLLMHGLHLGPDTGAKMAELLDARLTQVELEGLLSLMQQRIEERVPAAYLTGEAWFSDLPFHINRDVIIPRSPIAELIANGFHPFADLSRANRVLDLCTGSGCIGIACAVHYAHLQVDLVDISRPALEVAQRNIARHGLGERVATIESDLLAAVGDKKYDVIVSNPPYVDSGDMASMPAEYHHEPRLALEAGADGLALARRILKDAARFLNEHGVLVMEVGNSAPALDAAYPELEFLWLEFERGGHGVCLLRAEQLQSLV